MALTTPNMSLNVWDQLTDPYDHNQLATNWAKVDQHDHSSGKGLQIPTAGIQDAAITSAKIAPGAIPTFTIEDGSITKQKLAPGVLDVTNFGNFPAARITHNADQTYLGGVGGWANINFNTSNFDTDTMHTSPGSAGLTCKTPGLYSISSQVTLTQPNSFFYYWYPYNNGIQTRILVNSGSVIAQSSRALTPNGWYYAYGYTGGLFNVTLTTIYRLALNDFVSLQVALYTASYYFTIAAIASFSPVLSAAWIGN